MRRSDEAEGGVWPPRSNGPCWSPKGLSQDGPSKLSCLRQECQGLCSPVSISHQVWPPQEGVALGEGLCSCGHPSRLLVTRLPAAGTAGSHTMGRSRKVKVERLMLHQELGGCQAVDTRPPPCRQVSAPQPLPEPSPYHPARKVSPAARSACSA